MPSSHLILCRPLLLLPSVFRSIREFSKESVLHIRWPKYWSFSFSISPSNEYSGLIFRMDWLDLLAVQGTLKSLLQHHSSKASILRCSALFFFFFVLEIFILMKFFFGGGLSLFVFLKTWNTLRICMSSLCRGHAIFSVSFLFSICAAEASTSAFFIVQLSHPYMTTGKTIALTRWTFVGKVISLLFNMLSRLVIAFLSRSKHPLISGLQSPSAVILEPPKIKSLFPLFIHLFALK